MTIASEFLVIMGRLSRHVGFTFRAAYTFFTVRFRAIVGTVSAHIHSIDLLRRLRSSAGLEDRDTSPLRRHLNTAHSNLLSHHLT
jgi:hypothetical protein